MAGKYDNINPKDESIREFFNIVDELASYDDLETKIHENSNDNLLEILRNGKRLCVIGGMDASIIYDTDEHLYYLLGDIYRARLSIPYVSDPEREAHRLAVLAERNKAILEDAR